MIIPVMTFVPYQPFDLGPILKVTGDQQNFKIAILVVRVWDSLITMIHGVKEVGGSTPAGSE